MKIKLDLDALTVETFETTGPDALRGTVNGNACSDTTCLQIICDITNGGPNNGTCDYSCADPCGATDLNCSGGTGTGTGTGTGLPTRDQTCCTGGQIICSCAGQ